MCLITLSFTPDQERHLLLAANRDEFHARPARPMAWWPGSPSVLAGRDEQAGGTWLAVARDGRWAAVTNVRDPRAPRGQRSRGELPLAFFEGGLSPADHARQVQAQRAEYGPFNLLVGDAGSVWFASSHGELTEVAPGVHAVSNGALDAAWPKSTRIAEGLAALQSHPFSAGQALDLMYDTAPGADEALPDTGVGLEMERFLSSPFILSERYGTRCTTVLALGSSSQASERRFDTDGQPVGQLDYGWKA